MFFVIDRPRLRRMIAITRDDHHKVDQGHGGPFFRIEADSERVRVNGLRVAATFPATVYEPGVLFIRVTLFRKLLGTFRGEKFLTIQSDGKELIFGDVHMPLESNDMLLYSNPASAPDRHPDDSELAQSIKEAKATVEAAERELEKARQELERLESFPENPQGRLFP